MIPSVVGVTGILNMRSKKMLTQEMKTIMKQQNEPLNKRQKL